MAISLLHFIRRVRGRYWWAPGTASSNITGRQNNFSQVPFFNTQIQAIHEDSAGTIWASTYGNGVYFYNPLSARQRATCGMQANNPNSISNNYVNNLFQDSKGNMWFCTEDGVCSYNPDTKQIKRYSTSCRPDLQNAGRCSRYIMDLYLRGLVQFNPATSAMLNYTTQHMAC